MGLRGVRSLLDEDPNRFGESLVLTSSGDAASTTIIYIDAMALIYHHLRRQQENDDIVSGVIAFIQQLMQVASQIHVCFDGLAPAEKRATQVERLAQQYQECEMFAQSTNNEQRKKRRKPIMLDLFTELEVVKALVKLRDRNENSHNDNLLVLHRPTIGEAEADIDRLIEVQARKDPRSNIYILSEDSDFLVYPHCPGFVPLRSIRFDRSQSDEASGGGQTTTTRLIAWHYTQEKFRASFWNAFILNHSSPSASYFQVMTTMAALGGCDYTLDDEGIRQRLLNKLKRSMVKSDLGGLRPKQRTNPTAKQTMIALQRVIMHFVNGGSGGYGDWQVELIEKFEPSDVQSQTLLLDSLRRIHSIYATPTIPSPTSSIQQLSPIMVDAQRILCQGTIYCAPMVVEENLSVLLKEGDQQTKISSIWQLNKFSNTRRRLYSVIQYMATTSKTMPNALDQIWTQDSCPTVVEIQKTGKGKNVTAKQVHVQVEHLDQNIYAIFDVDASRDQQYQSLVDLSILGKAVTVNDALPGNLQSWVRVTSLLPSNWGIFLLLLTTAPVAFVDTVSSAIKCLKEGESSAPSGQLLKLFQSSARVAWYHVMFVESTIALSTNSVTDSATNHIDSTLLSLSNQWVEFLWSTLSTSLQLDRPRSYESIELSRLLDNVFHRLRDLGVGQLLDCDWSNTFLDWKRSITLVL